MTLSDEELGLLTFYLSVVVGIPISVFGIVANIINFAVFLKQRGKDCITVGLIALTISDFLSILFGAFSMLFSLIHQMGVVTVVHINAFRHVTSYPSSMFYSMSQGVLAFIALERCLCVALPLKFRNIFTFKRSILIVSGIYLTIFAVYLPHYSTSGLHWVRDPRTNTSIMMTWFSKEWIIAYKVIFILDGIFLQSAYLIIVFISTYVMIRDLIRSSKFRKQKAVEVERSVVEGVVGDTPRRKEQEHTMSKTNRSVIKTVAILALIFLVANTFQVVFTYCILLEPALSVNGSLYRICLIVQGVVLISRTLNCSINVIVYYTFNPSFRQTLQGLCAWNIGETSD